MRKTRRTETAPPAPVLADEAGRLLDGYGALDFALPAGAYAYVLGEDDGAGGVRWFYAGDSGARGGNILQRLGAQVATYGLAPEGGRITAIRVIPCGMDTTADDKVQGRAGHRALTTAQAIAARLGTDNILGSAAHEAARRRSRGMDLPLNRPRSVSRRAAG